MTLTTGTGMAGPTTHGVRSEWVPLLLVLFTALLVRLVFFVGYQGGDDRNYLAYAAYINREHSISTLSAQTQWVGRLGHWLPLAGAMRLFGDTQFGFALVPLICSLAGVAVTFVLGVATVGRQAALLGALLLAFLPLDVLYATRAFPDGPVALFMVGALLFALKSRASTSLVYPLLAGLALGAGYLIKETAVYAFLPLTFILRGWLPSSWRNLAILGAAFAIVLGAEAGFWTFAKGDPFYRSHATSAALDTVAQNMKGGSTWILGIIPGPRPMDVFRSNNTVADVALMLTTNEEFALFYWIGVPVLAWLAWIRDRRTRDLRMWVVTLFLLFAFLPVVNWPQYTLPRDPRYYTPLSIPLVLVMASYLLAGSRARLVAGTGLLLFSGVAASWVGAESSKMEPQRTMVRTYLATEQPVWVTPQFGADLLFLGNDRDDTYVRVHLLEQTRRAGSFEAIELARPQTPVAEGPTAIRGGVLILQEKNANKAPTGWALEGRLEGQPSRLTVLLQGGLRGAGLDGFARKIAPGGGQTVLVFACRMPECAGKP